MNRSALKSIQNVCQRNILAAILYGFYVGAFQPTEVTLLAQKNRHRARQAPNIRSLKSFPMFGCIRKERCLSCRQCFSLRPSKSYFHRNGFMQVEEARINECWHDRSIKSAMTTSFAHSSNDTVSCMLCVICVQCWRNLNIDITSSLSKLICFNLMRIIWKYSSGGRIHGTHVAMASYD